MNDRTTSSCAGVDKPVIMLAHGGGGKLMHQLIQEIFLPAFTNPALNELGDSALWKLNGCKLAFTTDAFVVTPIEFPGGDIGKLAITGTINDLAVAGARPICLSASFILEEGLPIETLERIVASMRETAIAVGVPIVTGDTKVVSRGAADQMFITTAGIGVVEADVSPQRIQPDDIVLINGCIGDHGMAVMVARERLGFETEVMSDCAPLWSLIERLLRECPGVHCLKDPTRGGIGTALSEIAEASNLCIEIYEDALPIRPAVMSACEILGIDPLYVANEGKVIVIVAHKYAQLALDIMRSHPLGRDAAIIGSVLPKPPQRVLLRTTLGVRRIVEAFSGEQLPRIC